MDKPKTNVERLEDCEKQLRQLRADYLAVRRYNDILVPLAELAIRDLQNQQQVTIETDKRLGIR